VVGVHAELAQPGDASRLKGKLLSDYRSDPATRKFFDRHHERMKPAMEGILADEIRLRESLAEVEALEEAKEADRAGDPGPPNRLLEKANKAHTAK
jgi:hypothetical protein